MPTLSRLSAAFAIVLTLASCQVGGGMTSSRAAPVLGGALQIGVPAGYCIDGKASRESRDSAVFLMGRCSDAMKATPALITVSIGQGGSAGVMTAGGPALAAFFASNQGLAMLSRSGRAGDVKIIAALGSGDAFLLHLQDRNVGEYWRAVIGVKGRLVTVSATGTDDIRLDPAEGRKIVEQTLDALRAANKPAA
ncbi:MAG: hypothetical protein CFE33_03525 [Pseudorhodobacter sp. PARRP1]|nr:MAG: hypothetical protein CFE33_03525 [Pseudorhodobacter sp. PARRP1]